MKNYELEENENSYSSLLTEAIPSSCIAEKVREYSFISEKHVQIMWLEQKYFIGLQTECGKKIEVLSPGIWNAAEGPDFKKAHLLIGDREYYGDVEIHLSDDGWRQHEHHLDPNYNKVIFHLSFRRPLHRKEILTAENRSIIRAHLEDYLTIPENRIIRLIDPDLYPYKKFCGTGKCADRLFKRLSKSKIETLFKGAADWRQEKKREHLEARTEDPDSYFIAGIVMALGYKKNSEKFLDLFRYFSSFPALSSQEIFIRSMEICGFFNDFFKNKWGDSLYYENLCSVSEGSSGKEKYHLLLHTAHTRPFNHPIRRLVYFSYLIKDPLLYDRYRQIELLWEAQNFSLYSEKKYKVLLKQFLELIPSYDDEYWNSRYLFEQKEKNTFLPLIGEGLKIEIVINTVIPLLHNSIEKRGDHAEKEALKAFFGSLKGAETKKSQYLKYRFFGDSEKTHLLNRADLLQGAYQLHHDFCIHYESGCEGCPFVERYENTFNSREILLV